MSEIKLKPRGVKLLLRVKEHILEEPKRVAMRNWLITDLDSAGIPQSERPECGTVACVAGWVVVLSVDVRRVKSIPASAVRLLGWSSNDFGRGWNFPLFFTEQWPVDLGRKIRMLVSGTPEYAAVVAAAIDRFIANPAEFEVL